MISILGTGGIGKATLASAVGHAALAYFAGAVFFVPPSRMRSYKDYLGNVRAAPRLERRCLR
ncbi:hypothetical protein U8Q05_29980 (plasmid) [Rhizobium ruizarguesonis]|nr:hypothetical protein U8Q05_29980 [Rhizobium ruizarguesonis]